MSRAYWHTKDGEAELHGSERAHLHFVAEAAATCAWGLQEPYDDLARADAILSLIPQAERGYLQDIRDNVAADAGNPRRVQMFVRALATALKVGDLRVVVDGVALDTRDLALNTALATGSAPVQLAAKIHGWCEVHCWVEGPDRAWLASVIDEGLTQGCYRWAMSYSPYPGGKQKRVEQGWGDVLALLRSSDSGPVVLSYSVTDFFPNHNIAAWSPPTMPEDWRPAFFEKAEWEALSGQLRQEYRDEHLDELFWELPAAQRWETAMAGLREQRPWARLGPDTLASTYFGAPVTIDDLFAPDRDERIARAAHVPMASRA